MKDNQGGSKARLAFIVLLMMITGGDRQFAQHSRYLSFPRLSDLCYDSLLLQARV